MSDKISVNELVVMRSIMLFLIILPLFSWWIQWIAPHYLNREFEYWPIYGSLILINLTIPATISWVQTLILVLLSIGIWFNFV